MKARRLPAHRSSRWWPLLLAWPAIALALGHGDGCGEKQIELDVLDALTRTAGLALIGVLAWGLFAIRGWWWWRVFSNLIQVALSAGLVSLLSSINLEYHLSCGGDRSSLYTIMAFNFLPALMLWGTLLLFRKIGRRMA